MLPHEEWLFKAGNDLESAKYLLTSEKKLYDIIVYHCQQSAEKSLKAFLAYNRQELNKTHDLKTLLDECKDILPQFNDILDDCIFLNPFATLYRYPEGDLTPSLEEVEKAISTAEKIISFVTENIK